MNTTGAPRTAAGYWNLGATGGACWAFGETAHAVKSALSAVAMSAGGSGGGVGQGAGPASDGGFGGSTAVNVGAGGDADPAGCPAIGDLCVEAPAGTNCGTNAVCDGIGHCFVTMAFG